MAKKKEKVVDDVIETPTAVIDKNIFSTSGNSTVFGNLSAATQSLTNSTVSSFTRGLIPGGFISPAYQTKIEYVTFSTEGNAADFGDITVARATGAGFSNSVRGGVGGGELRFPNLYQGQNTIGTIGNRYRINQNLMNYTPGSIFSGN